MGLWRKWRSAVTVVALFGAFLNQAWADDIGPRSEYARRLKNFESIQPHGDAPFGEQISAYTGDLSFTQADIVLEGKGPTISLARTTASPANSEYRITPHAFGNWMLSVPRIETLIQHDLTIPNPGSPGQQWIIANYNDPDRYARCTRFDRPMFLGPYPEAWNGMDLYIEDGGQQAVMRRATGNNLKPTMLNSQGNPIAFPAVTHDHWQIGCLENTSNGEAGEAFFVVSPDGTKYWFDYLDNVGAHTIKQMEEGVVLRQRRTLAIMYVSRIEDRFGNYLTYAYADGKLTSITASDGRKATIQWDSASPLVTSITLMPTSGQARTWQYHYINQTTEPELYEVILPDGTSRWRFEGIGNPLGSTPYPEFTECNIRTYDNSGTGYSDVTITHPSGLVGKFGRRSIVHGRSYLPSACHHAPPGVPDEFPYEEIPVLFRTPSLVRKEIYGPGVSSKVWTYKYPNAQGSTMEDACYAAGTCLATKLVEMTDPVGNVTKYLYSTRIGETEGKLLKTDYYQGASTLLRSEALIYASSAQGPYPSLLGSTMVDGGSNAAKDNRLTPLKIKTITQQGKVFKWEAKSFDVYANTIGVTRSSDLAAPNSQSDYTDYHHNLSLWAIGQVQRVRDSADGVTPGATVLQETVFDAATALPTSTYAFGQLKQSFTYYADGLLNTVKDALNHTYTFSNYKRGIAQRIDFPDTRFITASVDDFGQLTAVTDPLGNTTGYGYDVMGRMIAIDRPAGWTDTSISFAPSASPVYGLPGGHWRQTVSTGNKRTISYFDAMWRPVVVENYDAGNTSGTLSQSVTRYDGLGRTGFVSYPQRNLDPAVYNTWANPAVTPNALGTRTTYDALGRPLQVSQDAELGSPLLTQYQYLNGFQTRVTDPRLAVTTTSFQAFDRPSTDAPTIVQLPESVTTTISRDKFGKTQSITRSGPHAGGATLLTRSYVYDASHRLCRVNEPETGSSVTAYDAADNVAWSAAGMSIAGTGCGYEQVAAAARTTRSYDVMNRVTGVDYPVGTGDIAYTYDAAGNVATATAKGASSAQDVVWTYGARNTLGLPTSETLAVDGFSYTLQYGYDVQGTLRTLTYPDGRVVDYLPNALGQARQAGGYAGNVSYFPDGDIASYQYGNGITFAAQKNARALPNNLTYANSGLLYSQDLTYDANANLTNVTDLAPGTPSRSKTMGYDALNRLTSAAAPALWGTETYTYDALDNIRNITRGGVNNRFDYNALNRLTRIANAANEQTLHSYDYDSKGNVTERDGATLSFDEANRLLAYAGKGGYRYDAWARRVKRANGSGVTQSYYLYSQAGQMLFEHDLTTNKLTDYVYLGGKLVAKIAADAPIPALQAPELSNASSYTVSWTAISGATAYALEESINGGAWAQVYNGANLSWNAVGKAHGSQYAYRVRACTPSCGNYSVAVTVTVDLKPQSAPATSSPTYSDGPNYNVSWTAVAAATSYEVKQNGGAFYTGAALSKAVIGQPSGTYFYQARACNSYGCGPFGNTASTSVDLPPATAPVLSVPATNNTGSYTVSWSATTGATTYTLEESLNGGAWSVVQNSAALSWNASGKPNGNHAYRAKSCNPDGCSGYSANVVILVTYPPASAPGVSTPASSFNGSYTVSWTGVATATRYILQESFNGGAWTTRYDGAGGAYNATGHTDGSHAFRAQACNAGGCGPWSATATTQVELTPPTPVLSGYREIETEVRPPYIDWYISWSASAGATRYELDVQMMPSGTRGTTYQGPALSYHIGGHGSRTFWVRACRGVSNCSAWSGPLQL